MPGRRTLLACLIGLLLGAAGAAALSSPERQQQALLLAINLRDAGSSQFQHAHALLAAGYVHAPALVLGMAGLIALPAIALATVCTRAVIAAGRRRVGQPRTPLDLEPVTSIVRRPAWLLVEGGNRQALRLARELTSIGRDDDNDVMLADETVHRHHAVLQRTADATYIVTDVSGIDGHGIAVDGRRVMHATLSGGETIDLGRVRLKFMRSHVMPTSAPPTTAGMASRAHA